MKLSLVLVVGVALAAQASAQSRPPATRIDPVTETLLDVHDGALRQQGLRAVGDDDRHAVAGESVLFGGGHRLLRILDRLLWPGQDRKQNANGTDSRPDGKVPLPAAGRSGRFPDGLHRSARFPSRILIVRRYR